MTENITLDTEATILDHTGNKVKARDVICAHQHTIITDLKALKALSNNPVVKLSIDGVTLLVNAILTKLCSKGL